MRATVKRATCNIYEAMALAGVSRRTIYNWLTAGKITRLETPGGAPRFYVDELGTTVVTPKHAAGSK
jgi:predicted site-specific integrase-resolvase